MEDAHNFMQTRRELSRCTIVLLSVAQDHPYVPGALATWLSCSCLTTCGIDQTCLHCRG